MGGRWAADQRRWGPEMASKSPNGHSFPLPNGLGEGEGVLRETQETLSQSAKASSSYSAVSDTHSLVPGGVMSPFSDAEGKPKTRVLLVESNADLLLAATELLGRWRELILVGAAGWDDKTLAHARRLDPQVILMDLDRPNTAGLAAIALMRATMPQAGIVAFSLSMENALCRAARIAGADKVVAKDSLSTDLLPAILHAADCRRP